MNFARLFNQCRYRWIPLSKSSINTTNKLLTLQLHHLHGTPSINHSHGCGCGTTHHQSELDQYVEHVQPIYDPPPVIEPIPLTDKQINEYLSELHTLKPQIQLAYQSGNYRTALELQNQSSVIIQQLYTNQSIRYAVAVNNEALFNKLLGNTQRALHLYKQSLLIYESCHQHHTIDYGVMSHNIGTIYRDIGDMEQAEYHLNRALDIHKSCNANNCNTANIATTQYILASIYRMNHQYNRAIELQLDSIVLLKRKYGVHDIHLASAYNNIAYTYKSMAQYDEALRYYSDALRIRTSELPSGHTDIIVTLNNIAELHSAMGNQQHSQNVRRYIMDLIQQNEHKQNNTQQTGTNTE